MDGWKWTIAAGLIALAAPAGAQTVASEDPASIVAALQDLGYRAALGTDSEGAPKIQSAIEGVNYTIWFYGCEGGANCKVLNFSAGFDLAEGTDLATLNEWNRRKIVGRAYADSELDPFIDHPVVLTGGVSRDTFGEILRRWGWTVAQFKEHIDF